MDQLALPWDDAEGPWRLAGDDERLALVEDLYSALRAERAASGEPLIEWPEELAPEA